MYKIKSIAIIFMSLIPFFSVISQEDYLGKKEKNIFSPQASLPDIAFKNSAGTSLAEIMEETDRANLKFGSLSLTKANSTVNSDMTNKLWIDRNSNLMFGDNSLTGIWSFIGGTLTFPTGYMVIGNAVTEAANTQVLNVLGRARVKSFRMNDGSEGEGKVLTSDANGVATWETSSGGGSIDLLFDGKSTEGSGNVYLGEFAGNNDNSNSGTENVGVGKNSLSEILTNQGLQNTAIGSESMKNFLSGNYNTAVGSQSLYGGSGSASGDENTAIGHGALRNNTNGTGNIALGFEAGKTSSGNDKLYIHNSDAGDASLIYGDFQFYDLTINGSLEVTQGITGTVYPPSDQRFKKNIEPLSNSLKNILSLEGVSYDWKINEFPKKKFTDKKQIGLIAQQVEEIIPEIVNTRRDGYKGVEYSKLTAVLIEAIKEQQSIINSLKKQNIDLTQRMENIERIINNNKFTKAN